MSSATPAPSVMKQVLWHLIVSMLVMVTVTKWIAMETVLVLLHGHERLTTMNTFVCGDLLAASQSSQTLELLV